MMKWAWVQCSVKNVDLQDFIQELTQLNVDPRGLQRENKEIQFTCRANQYRKVTQAARKYGGISRVLQRKGIYFLLKKGLKRKGIWLGIACFEVCLLVSQQYIWHVRFPNMDSVQKKRAETVLRQVGIYEGVRSTEELLSLGETELVRKQIGFGWASLNFEKGRLLVETAPAEPIPPIFTARDTDIIAKTAGEIVSVSVEAGTAMVKSGDVVMPGNILIARDKLDREGKPVPGQAAGRVVASFVWETEYDQPLQYDIQRPCLKMQTSHSLQIGNQHFGKKEDEQANAVVRHYPFMLGELPLPGTWTEENVLLMENSTGMFTETLAKAKAKKHCQDEMYAQWGDAKIIAEQESFSMENEILHYKYRAKIEADICVK